MFARLVLDTDLVILDTFELENYTEILSPNPTIPNVFVVTFRPS